MSATIIEPEIKPDIIKKAIEYLRENEPYGPVQITDPDIQFANKIGYMDAILMLEKFTVEGGYDTDDYIEGYFAGMGT